MTRRQWTGGRPCKLTVPVALVEAVGRGEPLDEAARAAGCGPSTLARWLAAGRAGDPRFRPLADALDRARQSSGLARALRRADRDWVRCLSQI